MLPQFLRDLCHPFAQLPHRILEAGLFFAVDFDRFALLCFLLRVVMLRTELSHRSLLPVFPSIGSSLQLPTTPELIFLPDLRRALCHYLITPIILDVHIGVDHALLPSLLIIIITMRLWYIMMDYHSWLIIPFSLRYFIYFMACSLPLISFTNFVLPCSCRIFSARFR